MRFLQIIILIFMCWIPQYTGEPGDETQQHGTIVDASFDIDDLGSADAEVRLSRQASFHKDIDERRLISVNRAGKLPRHRRPGGKKKSVFRNRHGSQNINKEHRNHNPHAHRHRIQGTSGEGRGKHPPESSRQVESAAVAARFMPNSAQNEPASADASRVGTAVASRVRPKTALRVITLNTSSLLTDDRVLRLLRKPGVRAHFIPSEHDSKETLVFDIPSRRKPIVINVPKRMKNRLLRPFIEEANRGRTIDNLEALNRFGPAKTNDQTRIDNAKPSADLSETSTVTSTAKPHRTTLAGSTRSSRPNDADLTEPQPTFAPRLHPKFVGFNFTRFHGRLDTFGGNSHTTRFPETFGAQGISRSTMGRTRPPPTAPPRPITAPPQPPTMIANPVTQTPIMITRQPTRITRPQPSPSLVPSTIPSMTRPLAIHRSTIMMRSFTRRPPQRPPTVTSDSSTNSQSVSVASTAEALKPSSFSPPVSTTRISSTAESERAPPINVVHTTVPVLNTRLVGAETTPTTPLTPSDPTIPMRIFAPASAPGFTLVPPQSPPRMTDPMESISRTSTVTVSPSSSTTVLVTTDTVSETARLPTVAQTPPTAPPAGVESNSIDEPAPPAPPQQQSSPPQLGAFAGFPMVPGAPGAIPPDDFVVNALNNADDFLEVARKLKLKRIVRRKRMAEIQRNKYWGN